MLKTLAFWIKAYGPLSPIKAFRRLRATSKVPTEAAPGILELWKNGLLLLRYILYKGILPTTISRGRDSRDVQVEEEETGVYMYDEEQGTGYDSMQPFGVDDQPIGG